MAAFEDEAVHDDGAPNRTEASFLLEERPLGNGHFGAFQQRGTCWFYIPLHTNKVGIVAIVALVSWVEHVNSRVHNSSTDSYPGSRRPGCLARSQRRIYELDHITGCMSWKVFALGRFLKVWAWETTPRATS